MTRKQVKEFLPILQAFADGKEIECSEKDKWYRVLEICNEINPQDYRIKPELKYRPFKNKKECWQEMLKHQPFGWITDCSRICNIICIREDGILANTNINGTFYEFESSINLKFADGTPFGIMEN